ncbi:MAG: EVE domain-containing protein [Thermoplasmata archaeon]
MAYWLAKSEPGVYSYADLERDGRTEWSGIHNAAALLYLRKMRPGDRMLLYHSGDERAAVGIARVASAPHPDAADDRGSWSVEVRPVRPLARPVTLSELRADPAFADFLLLRISRLSVMPVAPALWTRILARSAAGSSPTPARSQGKKLGSRSNNRAAGARKRGMT